MPNLVKVLRDVEIDGGGSRVLSQVICTGCELSIVTVVLYCDFSGTHSVFLSKESALLCEHIYVYKQFFQKLWIEMTID